MQGVRTVIERAHWAHAFADAIGSADAADRSRSTVPEARIRPPAKRHHSTPVPFQTRIDDLAVIPFKTVRDESETRDEHQRCVREVRS